MSQVALADTVAKPAAAAGTSDKSGNYACASFGYYSNIPTDLVQNWLNENCDKTKPFSIAISDGPGESATEACCIQK